MRVGIIGTGAIAGKHAQAYRNIGYELIVCTNHTPAKGKKFAEDYGTKFVETFEEVCQDPRVDYVDVCTFPDFHLPVVECCAKTRKHILVEKPIATNLQTAREIIEVARKAKIQLGVVSQHRFDDPIPFLKKSIAEGRLGKILEADAYGKWYRTAEYYSRPIKGSWAVEGGGALINQGIHAVDLLLYLIGPVDRVFGNWQLGGLHAIESEDVVNALVRYSSGATGVIQASTAIWPGYTERIEIHGTRGSTILTGDDKITAWDIQGESDGSVPISSSGVTASGASDPMAITTVALERQFKDFGEACEKGRAPLVSGIEGYRALQLVTSVYDSCRQEKVIPIDSGDI
jgi:predicted dehydrogenase